MKTQAKTWGDGFTGLRQERAKRAMLGVHPRQVGHVKNWKPQLLVIDLLAEDALPMHPALLSVADQLKKGNGLVIFAGIKIGDETQQNFIQAREDRITLHEYFVSRRIEVLSKVVLCKKAKRGIKNVMQNAGLGVLEPNCLLMPLPEDLAQFESFEKAMKFARTLGLATLCVRPIELFELESERIRGTVDIWWLYYDGGLMCLIAFLLKKHKVWKKSQIRIFFVIPAEQAQVAEEALRRLKMWLKENRLFVSVYTEIIEIPVVLLACYTEMGKTIAAQGADYEPFFYKLENSYEIPSDARELNTQILNVSENSELVITVMPQKLKVHTSEDFLNYINAVIRGLKRVIIVTPTSNSVVTDNN
jgi:solute carrier family 12 (potassium/chloride transporter), member 4/6